jgi:beta-lactamase class D
MLVIEVRPLVNFIAKKVMTIKLTTILLFFFLTGLLISFEDVGDVNVDLSEFFIEYHVKGSFILFDKKKNQFKRYDSERCSERFIPASTFKIPNSIIAVEEHIVENANSLLKWDSIESGNQLWDKDLTLKEAFRVSCVPCYIRIANKVGDINYKKYLEKFDYGNKSTTVETDDSNLKIAFWLIGELKISQEEQISFLRKLYDYKLPASTHSIDVTKEILIDEKKDNYILSGKLGRGKISKDGKEIGWYVGYVEKGDNVYFFATNFESTNPSDNFGSARKDITLKVLRKLKVIV